MPIEIAAPDPLIDTLVADLAAVTPRRRSREAWLLAGLVAAEIALFVLMRGMRDDMPIAMLTPAFWWKAGSLALIAVLAAATTLVSLDPAVTTARLAPMWTALAIVAASALGLGWLIDAGAGGRDALLARLVWRDGLDCLVNVALLSLPVILALGILIRRGAPTQPGRTAISAGIAAAGFAAFVFAFHCGHDDPLYVAVWYGGALAAIAGLTRLILPRLSRW